jgi:hypothetical protein
MKKTILKHLNVTGYAEEIDLTDGDLLTKKLKDAKSNMQDAKKNVEQAKQELNQALKNSIKKIKKESEEQIDINKKGTAGFKLEFNQERDELKAKYHKMMGTLEHKGSEMKMKLDKYKDMGQGKWKSLKRELHNDLDVIEKTLKEFVVDNKKKVKKLAS